MIIIKIMMMVMIMMITIFDVNFQWRSNVPKSGGGGGGHTDT